MMKSKTPSQVDTNFQTPPEVCAYMVNMIPSQCVTVLEPTPGIGNLVHALLKEDRFQVSAADDFFLVPDESKFDCIIMNPPFTHKSAFLQNAPDDPEMKGMKLGYYILKKCMQMSNHIIALMPWFTLSDSDVRMRHLVSFGLKSITPLPRRTFQYARIQTVVIELQKGYQGKTIFYTPFHIKK